MNSTKRKSKRRWSVKERFDLKRKKLGIPADISPELVAHRREQQAATLQAKRPHPPRWLQRKRRLEAKAAEKTRLADARKSIAARLGMAAA